jgi:hypothetical protein
MDGLAKALFGVLTSILLLMFGVLFSELRAQNERVGYIQVRVASIDTALEILLDEYKGDE